MIKKNKSEQSGQVLVEFALAGIIAITMMFGCIEFGRALFAYDFVAQAARDATRYAIVNGTTCSTTGDACAANIKNVVLTKMTAPDQSVLNPAPVVTWQQPGGMNCYSPGCTVKVKVSYTFGFLILPLPSIVMSSTSQMNIAQ